MRWWFGAGRRQQQVVPAWRHAARTPAVSQRRPLLVAAPYLSLPALAGTTELVAIAPLPRPEPRVVRRGQEEVASASPARPAPRQRRSSPVPLARPASRRPSPPEPPWEPGRLDPSEGAEAGEEMGRVHAGPRPTWLPLTEATDDFVDVWGPVPDTDPHVAAGSAVEEPGPFDAGDEAGQASWPGDGPVSDDGLAGLIAMLDAEVAKGRAEHGEADPPGLLAAGSGSEERRRILRPTLASSRRQGLSPVPRPPAPEEPLQTATPPPGPEGEPGDQPQVHLDGTPADEPAGTSVAAPAAEPAAEPDAQPARAPEAEPSAEAPAVPAGEPAAESPSGPAQGSNAEAPAIPAGEPAAESPSGPAQGSIAEPLDRPAPAVAEPVPQPLDEALPKRVPPPLAEGPGEVPLPEAAPKATAPAPFSSSDPPASAAAIPWQVDERQVDEEQDRPEDATSKPHEEHPTDTPFEPSADVRHVVAPTGFRATLPEGLPRVPPSPQALPSQEVDPVAPRGGDRGSPPTEPGGGEVAPDRSAGDRPVSPLAMPRPTTRARASHEPPVSAAPEEAVASFHRMTGVDLGFVPLVRNPEATTATAQLHAQAFTRDGTVHLPPEVGDVDHTDAAALLGHELTHVMQQRALGPQAAEDGPLGEALEAQAYAVERALRGEPLDPAELEWPDGAGPAPGYLSWSPDTGFQAHVDHHPATGATAPTQRAPLHTAPSSHETTTSEAPPAAGGGLPPGEVDDAVPLVYPEPAMLEEPPADEGTSPEPQGLTDEDLDRITSRLTGAGATRAPALDPTDPVLLDQLAAGLYGRLRTRLRGELIADRERAGVLTEFS